MIFSAGLTCLFIAYWVFTIFIEGKQPSSAALLVARTLAMCGSTMLLLSIILVLEKYLP